jgi:Ca2+-binding RTX toxin-like protein
MSLTITLTADSRTGAGVDFNAGYAAFFKAFTPFELPLFLGPTGSSETTQILHLDTPVAGQEPQTRAVLLEGDDFLYTFSNHSISGTIDTVRLVRLGDAYNTVTGDLVTTGGLVTSAAQYITFSNLNITNAAGVKGDVHAIVAGLMGGGPSGTHADPAPLTAQVSGQAHVVNGSTGNDRYVGTIYGDTIRGNAGNDTLIGGKGWDRIDGGAGADVLTGGKGQDTFIFGSVNAARGDRITDFNPAEGDRINLAQLDANSKVAGNQAFTFISTDPFHHIAGELRVQVKSGQVILMGDTDGNGVADFRIYLTGAPDLSADHFVL